MTPSSLSSVTYTNADCHTVVRLRRVDVTTYLKEKWGITRAVTTLAKLASTGGGPKYQLFGRTPLYKSEDIDTWVASLMSPIKKSTSDCGGRHE